MSLTSSNKNKISIYRLDKPAVVGDVLLHLHDAVTLKNYDNIVISFPEKVDNISPNVASPLAGILEYYKTERNIDFQFENESQFLTKTHLLSPKQYKEDTRDHSSVINIVWKFEASNEVNGLVYSIVHELERKTQFETGVLPGIDWCLSEVMDNVLQHSAPDSNCPPVGYIMVQVHPKNDYVIFCISDFGQGIQKSLRHLVTPPKNSVDAITRAIQEGVTRDKKIGQGNGLWGLHNILRLNVGQLTITTGDGAWIFDGKNTSTKQDIPFLNDDSKGTVVDFQVNPNQKFSITEALNGYSPVNIRLESLENETGDQIIFVLKNEASGTGTRQSGMMLRNRILNAAVGSRLRIVIDFSGVSVIASSFADELIGKLVVKLGFVGFTQRIQLKNMNEIISPIINRSVTQRIAESF